jgi:hypothetical protein
MNRFTAPEVLDDEYTGNLYAPEDLSQIPNCRKVAAIQALNKLDADHKRILEATSGAKAALEGVREAMDKLVGAL